MAPPWNSRQRNWPTEPPLSPRANLGDSPRHSAKLWMPSSAHPLPAHKNFRRRRRSKKTAKNHPRGRGEGRDLADSLVPVRPRALRRNRSSLRGTGNLRGIARPPSHLAVPDVEEGAEAVLRNRARTRKSRTTEAK